MKIRKDKLQHYMVNLIVCYFTALLVYSYTQNVTCAVHSGFFAATGLSLGKEYGDKNAPGNHWCWWDLLADYLGNTTGILLFYLTIKIF
ncbi:hypothetical protein [Bacteroides caecimuris]|uniref:hypothetical protein n=1 Tax=Bacteroides caecimuris TaxID=1796613 RepID=UPI0025725A24|nr:hypothetical protein [Bacteroides caecimuris]